MFRSLCNAVFQIRNINGNYSTTQFLCFLRNPSFLIIRSISSSINHSSSSSSSSSSFVVSYLMKSCGMSEDKAISASKYIRFETSSRPDSVMTLLETNGLTKPYISKLIYVLPVLLLADPHKTLKPKLEFFNSIGLSGLDLVKVLSTSPNILLRSLKNKIIPTIAFLRSIVHTDKNVITVLKRSSRVLLEVTGERMVPNIELLRDQGVPESNITTLLITYTRALRINPVRFKEIVEEINGMGFDPLQHTFVVAIRVLTGISKSTREAKLDVYRRWGWSEDEIRKAFRKQPHCMMTSEKKIMAIMDFLVNQMGYSPSIMAQRPQVLVLSLEKTIIPRCSVIRILVSKGLIKKQFRITTVLTQVERFFLKNYVIKYEQEVP